jgi:hypothetical protein
MRSRASLRLINLSISGEETRRLRAHGGKGAGTMRDNPNLNLKPGLDRYKSVKFFMNPRNRICLYHRAIQ